LKETRGTQSLIYAAGLKTEVLLWNQFFFWSHYCKNDKHLITL